MLSDRQRQVLAAVVEAHLDSGRPVGSRTLASREAIIWSPSTVRAELAALEREGYLTHPHTSAGRLPTDSGYRFYVDTLLSAEKPPPLRGAIELSRMRSEVEDAIRETTAELSRINDLLAVVTAPPIESARIHRVEVLLPQPRVVTVVVIASNGEVSKRTLTFPEPVDPGVAEWASSYLNEKLAGLAVGARMIADRLADPQLGPRESAFLNDLAPALRDPDEAADHVLYLDGAARLLSEDHAAEIPRAEKLLEALERRVNLLGVMRSALNERSVFTWIGDENPRPELRGVSVVGANYGVAHRNLGSVGVMGPLRMDYATAISSVREAAGELSRFFETVYEE